MPDEDRSILEETMLNTARSKQPEFAANWVLENRPQAALAEDLGGILASWSSRNESDASHWISEHIADEELREAIARNAQQRDSDVDHDR